MAVEDNVKKFNVLLIDDEEDFRETLCTRLTDRGLVIQSAGNGTDGLEILKHFEADVVLLDVRMPGLSGIETLRLIKKHNPCIEVIILTGFASAETAVEVMELGAFDYLIKPVSFNELCYRLQDAFTHKCLDDDTDNRPVR